MENKDSFERMRKLAGINSTHVENSSSLINEVKSLLGDKKNIKKSDLTKLIREMANDEIEEAKKDEEKDKDSVDLEDLGIETDSTSEETPADEASTDDAPAESSEMDSGAKDIQDNLEKALEGAKAIGDEKLIDQIGNTITFLVRSHVVKENEELGDDGFKEGKVELKLGSYYDIMDLGDGEIKSDNQYLGFDLNTQEHIFRAMNAPGSTTFHFTMMPDKEINDYVKESI